MQSFRTEIENPVVERDILELERKIQLFHEGKIDEDKFRSLRLARGIYGQRQPGVQMIRIKLPFGRVTSEQLHRIADVSDEYSRGRLHITTRQDIQIHHVSLDRTPELWSELEKDNITLREACGNAVRNITASETAGIDPKEPFDVSPYADATFKFFLRNPICQEMGRKFKISFSGTEEDTALSFLHDIGFIAKIKEVDGEMVRGFKVMIAGGLGSQPRRANLGFNFLEADRIIPFIESVLRIFDRHGERNKRAKARLKFLIKDIGLDTFFALVEQEQKALSYQTYAIDTSEFDKPVELPKIDAPYVRINDLEVFKSWNDTNVFKQKQKGLFAIGLKIRLGDFYTDQARILADLVKKYAGNEIRLSLRQNIIIRNVKKELIPFFYSELQKLEFVETGYNSTLDITACPGTDTCNLGIASSTGIATVLERVLRKEYPAYVNNKDVTIKISGCMNACGQHNMAHIGFQGMSIKSGKYVAPALQVLLGGGILGDGKGRFGDKVIKVPSKRGPEALRFILNNFEHNVNEGESFLDYYDRQGEKYFYELLKPLADISNLKEDDFVDWGHNKSYIKAIGTGECAGVIIDLIATLLFESEEKIESATEALQLGKWADSIYHSYTSLINTAKAVLIAEGLKTNTQAGIIKDFDTYFIESGVIELDTSFSSLTYQIKENKPSLSFALKYLNDAKSFNRLVEALRANAVKDAV
jgi:sulfite reductase (ferredoxin)